MAALTPSAAAALVVDRRDASDAEVKDHSLYWVEDRYRSSSVSLGMAKAVYSSFNGALVACTRISSLRVARGALCCTECT